jgi:hypothetical protein
MRGEKARAALLLYSLIAGFAFSMGFMRGDPDLFHCPDPYLDLSPWLEVTSGIVIGVMFGHGVVWLSQRLVDRWRWKPALRLHIGLRQLLGVRDAPLGRGEIIVLVLSSAVAEELFFRGWLLPLIGLVSSSLVFGALHYVPNSRGMWTWVPLAVIMGLVFGLMFKTLGSLTAPIVAHMVINFQNLCFINRFDPLKGTAHGDLGV